ncbi:hypothetical protein HK102_002599, partial [Quaeritorhiza haematococci]
PFYNVAIAFGQFTEENGRTIRDIIHQNPAILHLASVYYVLSSEFDKNPWLIFTLRGLDLKKLLNITTEQIRGLSYPIPLEFIQTDNLVDTTSTSDDISGDASSQTTKPRGANSGIHKIPLQDRFILSCLQRNPPFSQSLDYWNVLDEFYRSLQKRDAVKKLFNIESAFKGVDLPKVAQVFSRSEIRIFAEDASLKMSSTSVLVKNPLFGEISVPHNLSEFGALIKERENFLRTDAGFGDIPFQLATPSKDMYESNDMLSIMSAPYTSTTPMIMRLTVWDTVRLLVSFPDQTDDSVGSPTYKWLWNLAQLTQVLVSACAILPDVLADSSMPTPALNETKLNNQDKRFRIIWKPLSTSRPVADQITFLSSLYPEQAPITVKGEDSDSVDIKGGGQRGCVYIRQQDGTFGALHPTSAGAVVLSCVLTYAVTQHNFVHKKGSSKAGVPKESQAFFQGFVFVPISITERSTGISIAKWAGVFNMMKADFDVTIQLQPVRTPSQPYDAGTYQLSLLCQDTQPAKGAIPSSSTTQQHTVRTYVQQRPHLKVPVLRFLASLGPYLKGIEMLFSQDTIVLTGEAFEAFILDTAGMLANLGISMVLPKELQRIFRPKAVLQPVNEDFLKEDRQKSANQATYLKLAQLLKFEWRIAMTPEPAADMADDDAGDGKDGSKTNAAQKLMNPSEFRTLVEGGRRLIRIKEEEAGVAGGDTFIRLDADDLKQITTTISKKPPTLTGLEVIRAGLGDQSIVLEANLQKYLTEMFRTKNHPVPSGLKATLREYQFRGYEWAISNLAHGFGVILADDMGLGKTIQTIAVLLNLKEKALSLGQAAPQTLLVVPTSLISNWLKELARFAPSLVATTFYGANRSASDLGLNAGADEDEEEAEGPPAKKRRVSSSSTSKKRGKQAGPQLQTYDIVITSYGTARREADALKKKKFACIVLDEAQNIKNRQSQTSKLIKAISSASTYRIALSGTPVENNLSELWSIFEFTLPKYLGTFKEFGDTYARPIEKDRDQSKLVALRAVSAPFMLRRLKTDKNIIKDLPPKIVDNKMASLSAQQAGIYESVVENITKQIMDPNLEKKKKRGLVLKLITSLKQLSFFEVSLSIPSICNHPIQFSAEAQTATQPTLPSTSTMDLDDINDEEEAESTNGAKRRGPLVNIEDVKRAAREAGKAGTLVNASGKAKMLMTVLEGVLARGDKVLIFTQRDDCVNKFQTDPSAQVFILSLKAGGVGLNLTAANHVIHYDLWWNPSVEAQATDRAFRIGQTKTVFVHRFICKGTFEEKIQEMLERKKELSDMSVHEGEKWLGDLSDEEIKELFSMRPAVAEE